MASKSARNPRCLEDALAELPDVSNNIIKSDEHYCNAGAFSDVYRRKYQDDSGDRAVEIAVKSFRFHFTLSESETEKNEGNGVRKMIRRELGIWRRLKHPNIVPFLGIAYGFGGPEHASLVSLWMPNGSLRNFLEKHDERLTIGHRLQLLSDIASGLSYLHSFPFPITHGDLSCNNVLIGHNYNACLTDFGYSSMVGDLPEASRYLQMTTMRPGTLRWAAPEYFSVNTEQVIKPTTQSDIYSFGNLGLLVLSGKQPWSEIQREAVVIVQLSLGKKPKRPSSRPIENQHWELIELCWSPIGNRPCATDVVSCLEKFLHSFPPLPLVDTFHALSHPTSGIDPPQPSALSISSVPERQYVRTHEPFPLGFNYIHFHEPPPTSISGVITTGDSDDGDHPSTVCTNCRTTNTPLWRADPEGRPLCNACGLFLKLHGGVHPLSLKTDIVKKERKRKRAANETIPVVTMPVKRHRDNIDILDTKKLFGDAPESASGDRQTTVNSLFSPATPDSGAPLPADGAARYRSELAMALDLTLSMISTTANQ